MAQEKQFEEKVKRFLTDQGTWFIKYWGGGLYTKDGIPDLLVCSFGRFVAVELKAHNGEPTDLQLRALHEIDKAGGAAILLYPDDLPIFRQLMQRMVEISHAEPEFFVEYLYFRKVRQEWERKRNLNFG